MENNELKHHGVKGMKWGHHKPQEEKDGMRSYGNNRLKNAIAYKQNTNKILSSKNMTTKEKKKAYTKEIESYRKSESDARSNQYAKGSKALKLGTLSTLLGATMYKSLKAQGTPQQVTMVQGLGVVGKLLSTYGTLNILDSSFRNTNGYSNKIRLETEMERKIKEARNRNQLYNI